MKISEIKLKNFKRFTDLTITNLKESYKLILVIGPNGSGKSSLFDSFITWMRFKGQMGMSNINNYYLKDTTLATAYYENVHIDYFGRKLNSQEIKKSIYVRTAYRNQDDFTVKGLNRFVDPTITPRINAMINNDAVVAENYQRLVSTTLDGVFKIVNDEKKVKELREELIGKIKSSLKNVFDDITLDNIGDPLQDGSFYFAKGLTKYFHYKNLSGGEKSIFDLILDIIIKSKYYDDSIYCIDEPEAHMHTDLQSRVLRELFNLIPDNCQLWITSHSLGMLNEARKLSIEFPETVAFLDFDGNNFDEKCVIEPVSIEYSVWNKFIKLALGNFSQLLGPEKLILCEGNKLGRRYKDFDAQCYNKIFSDKYFDYKFISIGNSIDIENDDNPIKLVLEELFKKERIKRLVDRDDKSKSEIDELAKKNIKVLRKRSIESYIFDDEILKKLCTSLNKNEKAEEVLAIKKKKIEDSASRGNAIDDIKSAAGEIYVEIKRILELTACGNTLDAFIRDTMLPLLTDETKIYEELETEIFT
jgi:predicted ATP-dependent endonuclease of OLD family